MEMTLNQAVKSALDNEMEKNDKIVLIGEDIGKNGGVFRTTEGLYDKYGPKRVIDTPLNESGIVGTAIGMSLYGLKPVVEIQFMDFIFPAFDQIVSDLAKFRYRTGGAYTCPMVIRAPYGGGIKGASYHSQSGETHFVHTSGLKVVVPSTPYETKGLLISAIRDDDPVIFFEPKRFYRALKEDVPEEAYTIPIGEARIVEEGSDVSLISYGPMIQTAIEAIEIVKKEGTSVELIDLRTLSPLDSKTIIKSVKKTGRAVIAHEAPKTLGMSAEIAALIAENCLEYLEAPIQRATGLDTPFPYSLEKEYLPDAKFVSKKIRQTVEYS
jgi:pyruvate/2-oxoglutarate/acetoin dehydrogenase E1 component|tara:strand:+ start:3751 stop:4725 length:975 start_codon:yes stop_codon:yes gene_type:complete